MNIQKFTTFKTILIALVLIISTNQLFAQTTNGIFFQAVARDNFSNPAKDRKIYVQSSIIQTTPTGTKVLTEEHQANTDATGVFSISLGNGVRVGGTASSLTTIDWSKGPFYLNLKVAITPIGGNSNWDYTKEWVDMGTTSFGAVPFALYSASSAKVDDKLNISDTTTMLKVYAKAIKVQSLETAVASKLTAADTLTMLAPYAKAAYTIDSSFFKAQLATKLSIADSTKYVTTSQLASYNFSSGGSNTTSVTMDTSSLSNRINLKANNADLDSLTAKVGNKLSITDTANLLKKTDTASLSSRINLKLDASKIGVANGVASLNASGVIPSSQLPPISISSTNVVSSDVDMLALSSATVGSIAIRTDLNKNFVLSTLPASTLANWVELLTPAAPVQTVNGFTGSINLSKVDIDLGNVNNTSDINKPVSTATQAALDLKLDASKVGTASGVASLNALGKIPSDQIPAISFSSVKVLASEAEMLALSSAVVGSVVIRTDINKNYVLAQANPAVLANWIQLLTPAPPVQTVNGMTGDITITKTTIDLANVNNTSDASKPISTAAQTALGAKADTAVVNPTLLLKAPLASPKFTGAVAIGTTSPASSAALDITSTTQGLLLPRLTYVQKTAIANPIAGLILFCSDCGTSGEMQLYNGTSFVNMIGATAQFAMPGITSTTAISAITTSSASSGGVINSDGGAAVTARGIVWGTSAGSSTFSATTGTGVGTFTSSMTGLTSGVTYYVRAYATNSVGTKYGPEISFNTSQAVATLAATTTVSAIGSTTATSGGNITYNGGATVTVSGIVWSTTSNPTIALTTKTTNGAANGAYTSNITGLTPGTLYYVRSYATNSVGTSYGAQTSFTSLNTPTINATASATSITSSTVSTGGTITADGGASVTSRGVVYGTSSLSSTFSVTSGTGTGTYTVSLTGLLPATTYYVRSFATNSVGTVYGTETSFTTNATVPTLTTTAASSITKYGASAGGTITSNGGSTITASGICWSTTATPTTSDFKTTDGTTTGIFTSALTGLTAGTTYYVRAYATNAIGTSYGANQSITTITPVITLPTVGSSYGGGVIAYVYQDGDPGYTSSNIPVLITANTTQGVSRWRNGLDITTGATSATLGSGFANTNTIISSQGEVTTSYAAGIARAYTDGTYTDWYLPSQEELNKLYLNRTTIGGFTGTMNYFWTSTESSNSTAKMQNFISAGAITNFVKSASGGYIRAVRTITLALSTNPSNSPVLASTTSATSITSSSAILGGNVTDEGATQVSVRGLVYGTTTGASTFSVTLGSGAGTFTGTITGLAQGTTYFVRSFATNVQGTSYGAETSFTTQTTPTVSVTATPTSITTTTAIGGGTISSTGGATITTSGLVWGASTNPEITLSTKTTNGTTSGTFTSSITGLTQGTTYYVRAYATNYLGTSYGPNITFTTLTTPAISGTASATSVTSSSATTGGTITADGGATVTSRGLVYGTSSGASTYSVTTGTGTGTYTSSLTGLTPATTYYVRSFATNSIGTVYGAETSFTTIAIAPTLTTTAASSITKYAASAGGTITSNGGSTITASGICWSTTATPTISNSKTTDGTTSGTFTSSLTGLTAGTTYYVRAYATNAIGTSYGANESFTTLSTPITQTTVLIGTQRWTDKNLNVSTYRNGEAITYAANATEWNAATNAGIGAWAYYDFNESNGLIFGKLYNWYAVNDTRSLAPSGYHIPTKAEFNTLASNSGSTLKAASSEWGASMGSNTTGFAGLPGGNNNITSSNRFEDKGTSGWFWTSEYDLANPLKAYFRLLHTSAGLVDVGSYLKTYGMSVRLVKDDNTIEASPTNPVLASTTSATSITANSAILGGNITDEGATQVSARGLVYGTTTGASTFSVTVGSGGGTFTGTLTGLAQGTTYFVRSFATNVQGTSYGAETSFTTQTIPTVSVTATPTSITTTTAIGGGTISSTGGATITTSGLVWGASTNPEITLSTKTTNGATSGTFTSSITGLTQGATYFVRAYATNSIGTGYGPNITFTTVTTPTVSATATVTSITGTTANGGGTISSDGGATVTSRGLVWGTTSGATTFSVTSGTGIGTYTASLTGLSIATTYFVRPFAINSAGTVYGPEVQFATPNTATLASTITSTITSSTAILGGVLSSTGGATTTIGIMYSTSSTFGTSTSTIINANASAGTYTTSISGLSAVTTYYAKAYATNTAGTTFGPTISFTTPVAPIAVGASYGGGKVFYIFQPADVGYYVEGETHGLIAATVDQSTGIRWNNSNRGNEITGATATAIGTGKSNTDKIINVQQGSLSWYAAGVARDYKGGGYTDWYLPSRDELNLLYTQKVMVGGFESSGGAPYVYFSSTETSFEDAHFTIFENGTNYPCCTYSKKNTTTNKVRAIRKF